MKGTPILFALILLLGGSFSLPSMSHASNPSTTPTIDGSSIQGCSHFTNSCSTLFSTFGSNDIVIVYAFETLDLQTSCSFSVKDTAGLSWEMRAAVSGRNDGTTASDRDQMAEFWARSASPLSADNVTESILGCASYEYGGEYNGLMVFGISGANFQNPFDPSGSVPASVSGLNGTPAALISTSNSSDMILGVALQSTYGVLSPGSGFSLISTGGRYSVSEYTVVNSPVTNFPVTFGDGANWYWEVIADAVQAANTTPDFSLSASPSSLTVTAGSSGTSTVTVTSVNNFTGMVNLQATVTPAGPSLSLDPSSVHAPPGGSGSSVLTVSTSNATAPAIYKVTITGTSGSGLHTSTVTVTVVSPALGPLGIDGSVVAGCGHTTNSCSATLSTLHGYDLIIVYTMESLDLQTTCNFSVNDTAGLYWTLRGGVSGRNDGTTGTNRDQIAEFWAASPSVLSSDIITESISGCASLEYGGEYNSLLVVAISGANLSSPFDPNVSLPGLASGYGNSPALTLSTGNRQDLIISAGQQSSFGTLTPGPGFAQIFSSGPGGSAEEYQTVNAPQTNLTVTFGDDATWYWEIMADAVQAAPPDPQVQQTTTFDGVTVSLSGSLVANTSTRTIAGTISAVVTNSATGQTVFSKTFSVSVRYGSDSTARFVLSVPSTPAWLAAVCSVNVSTDRASCTVSRDPDVNQDGVINILDLARIGFAYDSKVGDTRYNPSHDLNADGTVNIFDLAQVAIDYNLPVFS